MSEYEMKLRDLCQVAASAGQAELFDEIDELLRATGHSAVPRWRFWVADEVNVGVPIEALSSGVDPELIRRAARQFGIQTAR